MSNHKKSEKQNKGEGDREAARRFNESEEEFVASERGKQKIDKAGELKGGEEREAQAAEKEGRAHAKEKDPQVSRDYKKGEK